MVDALSWQKVHKRCTIWTKRMRRVLATLQCLAAASAFSATTAPVASRAAFAEWLVPLCPGLDGSRATLADDSTITAARAYNADQVIYSIGNDALLSPVAAYADKDVGPPLQPLLTSHPLAVGADAPPLRVASPLFALLLRRVCMSGPLVGQRWRLRRRFRRQPLALALALASSRCGGARAFVGSIEHSTSPARRSLRVRWICTQVAVAACTRRLRSERSPEGF